MHTHTHSKEWPKGGKIITVNNSCSSLAVYCQMCMQIMLSLLAAKYMEF